MNSMTPWMDTKGKIYDTLDNEEMVDCVGFIYEVQFNNGMKYLGRKALYHNRTLPPLKGTKRKRKKVVESDWLKYCGSIKNEEFKEGVKSGEIFPIARTILRFCKTAWEMTYHETRILFIQDALLQDSYYNSNILGKFYRPKES